MGLKRGCASTFLFEGAWLLSVPDVIVVTFRGLVITAGVRSFAPYSGRIYAAEESDEARERGDTEGMEGTEAQRFRRRSVSAKTCGVEVGNEADGGNGENGRVRVIERLTCFEGGVGGVATHVGGASTSNEATGDDSMEGDEGDAMDSSVSPRDMACPSSERGLWEDTVDDGVHTGEAVTDGRGRKPHALMFRGLIS